MLLVVTATSVAAWLLSSTKDSKRLRIFPRYGMKEPSASLAVK